MTADPPEPVGGVAGIRLAAMGNTMPVRRERGLTQVVGLLSGLVALVPEVVNLEQSGGQRQPSRASRRGQEPGQRRLGERGGQAWPGWCLLHERRAQAIVALQADSAQRGDDLESRKPQRLESFSRLEPPDDESGGGTPGVLILRGIF